MKVDNCNWFNDTSSKALKAFQVVILERFLNRFHSKFLAITAFNFIPTIQNNSVFRSPFETHHTQQLNRKPGLAPLQLASSNHYFVCWSRIAITHTKQSSVNVLVSYVQRHYNGQISSLSSSTLAIQDLSKALLLLFAPVLLQFCTISYDCY